MNIQEYEQLLDNCYAELPEVLNKKKRFVIPEVKGRVIKTRTQITNFSDIAKQLNRDISHMYRFMLKFVGVRGELNTEKGDVILFSRFQPAMLNKGVKSYYEQYVECSYCKSPDTTLENNGLKIKCSACGHEEKVPQI
ncbi:MAG: translation initiation factor IF-2 subunit beta [Candidatus Nanoarchaeia archaeon]